MRLRLAAFDLDGTPKQARDPCACHHEKLHTWEASQLMAARGAANFVSHRADGEED